MFGLIRVKNTVQSEKGSFILDLVQQVLPLIDDQWSFVFIKDVDHSYISCNKKYARSLGLPSVESVAGRSDLEINPNCAGLYRADDEKVLSGEVLTINNPAYFKDLGLVSVVGKIIPIRDESQNIVGILGTTRLNFSLADKPFAQALGMLNPKTIPFIVNKSHYQIKTNYGTATLTRREVECILFLFKCVTADDIAASLELSRRSIESYFVNIKNKLNVQHKSEILERVILGGLLDQL